MSGTGFLPRHWHHALCKATLIASSTAKPSTKYQSQFRHGKLKAMKTEFTAPRRLQPLYAPEPQAHEDEIRGPYNVMQQDAAIPELVQVHAPAKPEDYTISVEQVRDHFRSKGLTKSKDTVQRWCRNDDLDCQKLGLLGRYFTTETSLFELERKLLPDMIAENAGAAVVPLDAAANEPTRTDLPLHAPVDEPAHSNVQPDEGEGAAARSETPVQIPVGPLHAGEELASLRAEVVGLKDQLSEAKENAKFLREEIISSRGQRGDVVKIAEQMLGTLETIATGGRLERPRREGSQREQTSEPVRYDAQTSEVHDV